MADALMTGTLDNARGLLSCPIGFADLLKGLASKDRVSVERRITVLDAAAAPARAALWRRLACSLMTLAPLAKAIGKDAVQFYVADGRYRMQVFALEDLHDGHFAIYCPDVLAEALAAGLLNRMDGDVGGDADDMGDAAMLLVAASGELLQIDVLDKKSISPAPHFKDLTGWNRRALRVTLPPEPSPAQVDAAELLCAVAASHFVHAEPAASTAGMATIARTLVATTKGT